MLKIILIIIFCILYMGIGLGLDMWACDYRNADFYSNIDELLVFMILWPIFLLGSIIYILVEYFLEKKEK